MTGTSTFVLKAFQSTSEPFGFTTDLRSHAGNQASPQLAHWQRRGGP